MWLTLMLGVSLLFADPEFCGVVRVARYGEFRIEGNTDTPRRVILAMLDIEAGGKIRLGRFSSAQKRLRECPTLQTDVEKGIEPTISFEPDAKGEFWDVIVSVRDVSGSWLAYEILDLVWYSRQAVTYRDGRAAHAALGNLRYIIERAHR